MTADIDRHGRIIRANQNRNNDSGNSERERERGDSRDSSDNEDQNKLGLPALVGLSLLGAAVGVILGLLDE